MNTERKDAERTDAPAASNFIRNIIDDDNRTGAVAALDSRFDRGVDLGELRLVGVRTEGSRLATKRHKEAQKERKQW